MSTFGGTTTVLEDLNESRLGGEQKLEDTMEQQGSKLSVQKLSRHPTTVHTASSFNNLDWKDNGQSQEEIDPDFIPPPSSHPRGSSSPGAAPTDISYAESETYDDPFADYDIESGSEKEFLLESLEYAPVEEVREIRRSSQDMLPDAPSPASKWDITMMLHGFKEKIVASVLSDESTLPGSLAPEPFLIQRKWVENFAKAHTFTTPKHVPTTLQRRKFERDVYDFSRAIGMGRQQSNLEVQRARAVYRQCKGLSGVLLLDASDDESEIGAEIDDSAEYIASMTNALMYEPIDAAGAWAEITRIRAIQPISGHKVNKRKRGEDESKSGEPDQEKSEKSKKRRKRKKHGNTSEDIPTVESLPAKVTQNGTIETVISNKSKNKKPKKVSRSRVRQLLHEKKIVNVSTSSESGVVGEGGLSNVHLGHKDPLNKLSNSGSSAGLKSSSGDIIDKSAEVEKTRRKRNKKRQSIAEKKKIPLINDTESTGSAEEIPSNATPGKSETAKASDDNISNLPKSEESKNMEDVVSSKASAVKSGNGGEEVIDGFVDLRGKKKKQRKRKSGAAHSQEPNHDAKGKDENIELITIEKAEIEVAQPPASAPGEKLVRAGRRDRGKKSLGVSIIEPESQDPSASFPSRS